MSEAEVAQMVYAVNQTGDEKTEKITIRRTFSDMVSDISRYRMTEKYPLPMLVIICPSLVACIFYRIGRWIWCYEGFLDSLIYLLRPVYLCFKRLVELYTGISISPRAQIGRGLYINHFGSIFVGKCVIGENCNLSHEVTLGVAGRGDKKGLPTLGDRVYIAPGAKVIGKIHLGNDVVVGANAVVTKSVPDCAVVIGAPATIVSYRGSFDFILFKKMDTDPARCASMERSARLQGEKSQLDKLDYSANRVSIAEIMPLT